MTAESRSQRNQRLIAERTGWPPGALDTCRRLEVEHPGWRVAWLRENRYPGFERPAGWLASNETIHLEGADDDLPGRRRSARLFAQTPEALVKRMADLEERVAAEEAWREFRWRSMRREP
jgi:hypothetical protein